MVRDILHKLGWVNSAIMCIGTIMLCTIIFIVWRPGAQSNRIETITGDGKGYYMYLPSLFIKSNFGSEQADYRYLIETPYGVLNKYSAGTALLLTPFFSVAYLYYAFQATPIDGYEVGFQQAISMAALFYFLLGLVGLSKFLRLFGFKDSSIALGTVLIAFGTNTMVYVLNEPAFSHIYSFFAISFFLLYLKLFIDSSRRIHLYTAAIFFGITILIRPFDAVIILTFPFLAGTWATFITVLRRLISRPLDLVIGGIIIIGIFAIQQVLWFLQTGSFVFYAYVNEGFYFSKPQIFNVLFSFRKGLFVYTPMALLGLLGLVWIYRTRKFSLYAYAFFGIVLVYLISSWWNWYYGPSFGQRPFVDFYPFLVIPLVYLIDLTKSKVSKLIYYSIAMLCVGLNLIQSYQYRNQILSSSDMNFDKYVYTFGKLDKKYINVLGGSADIKPYHHSERLVYSASADFESSGGVIHFSNTVWDSLLHSKVVDYSKQEFNTSLQIPIDSTFVNGKHAYLKAYIDLRELSGFKLGDQPLLVVNLVDSIGHSYYYVPIGLKDVPIFKPDTWRELEFGLTLPIRSSSDALHAFIWNKPNASFYIDNFRVDVFVYE
jgi:hypothetical protein